MNTTYRGRRAARLSPAVNLQDAVPALTGKTGKGTHPQHSDSCDLIVQALLSIGKLAVSRKEAQSLLPYSGRTFRRFEQRNLLPRLKGTRRVVYAVSDLVKLVQEMR